LVYVGTRTGWVYALNLDSGDMVWRFFAAPRRERVIAFGQLESPWPLHGCVLVDDDGVWAIAGRHNDLDGGLWWWNLDPLTGEARSNGRLGRDDLRSTTGGGGATDSKDGTVPNGSTTPAVSDGEVVLLAGVWLKKESGKLVIWDGLKSSGEHERWTVRFPLDVVVPGNQGLLCPIDALSGYKMSYYGLTQAPLYAYNGNEFINVWGTTTIQHRGGSRDRNATVRLFRKYDTINQVKHPTDERRTIRVGSDVLWETPCRDADKAGVKAIAVAGDSVLIGLSVDNRDFWRARDEMAYRLRVLNLADGKPRQDDLRLPEAPVRGGISAAGGLVYVVSSDGTVTCFGG
jgi:hypothetical protein